MKFRKTLHHLVSQDPKIMTVPEFIIAGTPTDRNHTQRRMQQRAINIDMIRVAIAYGHYQFHTKARTWTILDKSLHNTIYENAVDHLRGLRIIASMDKPQENLFINTVYWDFKLAN